jgi:hypothetical protein
LKPPLLVLPQGFVYFLKKETAFFLFLFLVKRERRKKGKKRRFFFLKINKTLWQHQQWRLQRVT